VANLRRHLAGSVPPQDQILLLGPPYKVPRDSTLRSEDILSSLRLGDEEDGYCYTPTSSASVQTSMSTASRRCTLSTTERTGARRLFLFSKQALSESAPDPPPCTLEPMSLKLPTEPDPSPVSSLSPSTSSPLHQALQVYEQRFMLHLCRGRALADGADLRISACQKCVAEQSVMARALRAAVSNLSDHRNNATRAMTEFAAEFQSKTSRHADILGSFEGLMSSLAEEKLHPALISTANRSGRRLDTLLDTVPVERERAWAGQCRTAHSRLLSLYKELDSSFSQIGGSVAWEQEAKGDMAAEEEITKLTAEVEGDAMDIRTGQVERFDQLTKYHGEVAGVVMNVISGGNSASVTASEVGTTQSQTTQHNAQAAFSVLEEMSQASVNILPSMESDDVVLMNLMTKLADSKTRAMRRMRVRLREISIAQSTIQRVLSNLSVLRDALAQHCENILHLEHVAELKPSYKDFLSEIRRRRAYGGAASSLMSMMMERIGAMRVDEVKARERFLRGSGRHLMPAFFEIFAPTLTSPPPLFAPQLPSTVEMDSLPDVGAVADSTTTGESSSSNSITMSGMHGALEGIGGEQSNAISVESGADPGPVSGPSVRIDPDNNDAAAESNTGTATDRDSGNQQEQGLIVSADENCIDEIMGSYDEQQITAEVERKTMAYENATLRQALERMGGKPPRTYIVEAKARDEKKKALEAEEKRQKEIKASNAVLEENASLESKVAELQKELGELAATKLELEAAKLKAEEALKKSVNSSCDKISHSRFEVGDVGLFMPTGRDRGGKRTYLAFHSNCPHRYLETDSIDGTPDYVLGRIVYQEQLVAGPVGSDENPFGLHAGTRFWVLTVEVLKVP